MNCCVFHNVLQFIAEYNTASMQTTQSFNVFVNDIPVLHTQDTLLVEVNKQFDYVLEVIDKNLNCPNLGKSTAK